MNLPKHHVEPQIDASAPLTEAMIEPIMCVPEMWQKITRAAALFSDKAVRPTHAVNPLDIQGEIVSHDPLPIPPHLIFRVAEIRNDWFVFAAEHRVHVPRRLTDIGPLPESKLSEGLERPKRRRSKG